MANSQQALFSSGEQLILLFRQLIFTDHDKTGLQDFSIEQQHKILQLATQSGLGPLTYYYFRQHNIILDAANPVNHQLFLSGTAMALQRQAQLKTILKLLEQEAIEVLLLKGAWTAELLYPHPALRMMHDIDMLVMPEVEQRAYKLIKAQGYTPYAGEYDGPKHLPSLIPPKNHGLAIELHHDISTRSDKFNAKKLWEYSEIHEFYGIKVRVFIPEMLLLHHCLHMVEEYFGNGIKNITEAAFIIDKNLCELDKLLKLAATLNLTETLALSLAIVEKLFGITLPNAATQLPTIPPQILEDACSLICDKDIVIDKTSTMLSRECEERSLLSKVGFLIGRAFIHPAQIAGMYGCHKYSLKLPFYYLHRIVKYARSVPEAFSEQRQSGNNAMAHKIGKQQREIIDFCKINNYYG
jgi:hypothetical protein